MNAGGAVYSVDERDTVAELRGTPPSDVGAPLPHVLAAEGRVRLFYLVSGDPDAWDGAAVRAVSPESPGVKTAVVTFEVCAAHFFGPPNDEAFSGHPLARRGLRPYGNFQVENSSWLRALERMNAVHIHHRPEAFWRLKHFIFAFHDSTFECIAERFSAEIRRGALVRVLADFAGSGGGSDAR